MGTIDSSTPYNTGARSLIWEAMVLGVLQLPEHSGSRHTDRVAARALRVDCLLLLAGYAGMLNLRLRI